MEQRKPIDFKEVAKKFTEKYYPQWLSRVDRIWEMLEKIDPNSLFSESVESPYQLGNALGIAGETEPQFKECMSGIAVFAFTCHGLKDEEGIAGTDLQSRITTTSLNMNISPTLQSKLESVLSEMLPTIVGEAIRTEERKLEINFAETEVRISEQSPVSKNYSYILIEQIILKEKIHWLWGFVFLGRWVYGEVLKEHPKKQFGNYISKESKKLKEYGFIINHKRGDDEWWLDYETTKSKIECNLLEARGHYNEAEIDFENSKISEAIIKLESAISPINYPNVKFTDAYKLLIKCIFLVNYENIPESLLGKARSFVGWHRNRLKIAIFTIKNTYLARGVLSEAEIEDELTIMEIELKEITQTYDALKDKIKIKDSIREYEEIEYLINELLNIVQQIAFTKGDIEDIYETKEFILLKSRKTIKKIFKANDKYLQSFTPYINDKEGTEDFLLYQTIKGGVDFSKKKNLSSVLVLLKNRLTDRLVLRQSKS